jgi:hypothetical protein
MIPNITDKQINKYFSDKDNFSIAEIYQIMKKIKYPDIDVPKYKKNIINKVGF